MRSFLGCFLLFFITASSAFAQGPSKIGFQLQAYLSAADPSDQVDLFLSGDAADVARVVLTHGGRIKEAVKGWVNASVPVDAVRDLEREPAISGITFSLSPGRVLNDSMRVKARVNEAHQGLAPLPQAYDGTGVLIGIIDTGVDFLHPDFQDSLGRTRVMRYWDQNFAFDAALTPMPFGYGQAWDSTAINAGTCPATDPLNQYGHGSTVAGTAAGNGLATGHFMGVAPKADLIVVANDLDRPNWSSSIVDAVRYIIDRADELGRPVSINLSLGDYYGSHDGLDPAALLIDEMLTEETGRALVCAAGNSGTLAPYHLHTEVGSDTTFTWFRYKANSILGMGAVYFDLWADTAEFQQVQYSVGADRRTGGYLFRGNIPYRNIAGTIGQEVVDTLWSVDGNKLGQVATWAELRGGQYHMEVQIPLPDSVDQFNYRFSTTGSGSFDAWSSDLFGTSKMVVDVPTVIDFPAIVDYVLPDSASSIVDAWACSPHVITVANFNNQQSYIDALGNLQDFGGTPGMLAANSSKGPSRTGLLKPDVGAPGDATLSAGSLAVMQGLLVSEPNKLSLDSLHMRNGGTSIASPVVAGVAALLFQKCPDMSVDAVVQAIQDAAYADELTGSLPNTRFGYGKVDAFATLVGSNVDVPITGPETVCTGDSVQLTGPAGMLAYQWSTGSDQAFIFTAGDTLQLTVQTTSGCIGMSDTIVVMAYALPTPSFTADGSTLACTPAVSYQWYFDNAPIPGAEAQTYEAEVNGFYFVNVIDDHGCTSNSDTLLISSVIVQDRASSVDLNVVWPVPADGHIYVDVADLTDRDRHYRVLDTQGRTVLEGSLTAGVSRVDVTQLTPGSYTLRWGSQEVHSGRFIKR